MGKNNHGNQRSTFMRMTECGFSEQVIRFILTRDNEELGELTILNIAHKFNISQSHLYHIFQNEKKMPPGKFLTITKMLRSANLLEESDHSLTIKAISKKMGFSSSDYFTRIFKEHFGTTPGKYREYTHIKSKDPEKQIKNLKAKDLKVRHRKK